MPYALKNEFGEIIALSGTPFANNDTPISLNDPAVVAFLTRDTAIQEPSGKKDFELLMHDLNQIRILEDLIDLLTAKGVIMFSDLPVAAQAKILSKKTIREKMEESNDILVSDNPLL